MLNYALKLTKHKSFYNKYAAIPKGLLNTSLHLAHDLWPSQSSMWVPKWFLAWWAEGTEVVLTKELLTLKSQIRAVRAAVPPIEEQSKCQWSLLTCYVIQLHGFDACLILSINYFASIAYLLVCSKYPIWCPTKEVSLWLSKQFDDCR